MKKMETIYNSSLLHGERLTLLDFFIEILKSYEVDERPEITELIAYIQKFYTNLANAIQHERTHQSSQKIKELRKQRQTSLYSLLRGIKIFAKKPDRSRNEDAKYLLTLWNKAFADLNINNSSEASAGTDILLSLLNNATAEAALVKLTFNIDRAYLQETQSYLKKLVENRAIDEEQDTQPRLQECAIEVGHLFTYVKEQLHMKVTMGDDIYQEIIVKLNGRIGEIMTIARSRHTHAENDSPASQESDSITSQENHSQPTVDAD